MTRWTPHDATSGPGHAWAGAEPPVAPRREGQTVGGDSLLARYASFVKLPHTLFALPFAGVGAVLASYTHPHGVTLNAIAWILVAFTAARFAAMGFNRIVDRNYDAENPRTRQRELPAGRLTPLQAWAAVAAASALFIFAAWQLNPLCGWLSPIALAWVFFYSFTKRFTAWAHNVLGFALGIAPVGAYLAVTGEWSQPWWALVTLASAVMFWVAGFDVIYSLQDVEYDRARGLHSLPARKGVGRALGLAAVFHVHAVGFFLALWFFQRFPVGWLYLVGVAVMAAILLYEHVAIRRQRPDRLDLPTIDRAFFRANVGVSTSFFAFALLDRLLLA
jgi:4-hydroxybenzoate polyprenyltransferase